MLVPFSLSIDMLVSQRLWSCMFVCLCLSLSRQFTSNWSVTLQQTSLLPVYNISYLVVAFLHSSGVTMDLLSLELPEKSKTYTSFYAAARLKLPFLIFSPPTMSTGSSSGHSHLTLEVCGSLLPGLSNADWILSTCSPHVKTLSNACQVLKI